MYWKARAKSKKGPYRCIGIHLSLAVFHLKKWTWPAHSPYVTRTVWEMYRQWRAKSYILMVQYIEPYIQVWSRVVGLVDITKSNVVLFFSPLLYLLMSGNVKCYIDPKIVTVLLLVFFLGVDQNIQFETVHF